MKTLPLVLTSAVVALVVSAIFVRVLAPRRDAAAGEGSAASSAAFATLESELASVRASQSETRDKLASIERSLEMLSSRGMREPVGDPESLVAKWLDENREAVGELVAAAVERAPERSAAATEPTAAQRDMPGTLARLTDPSTDWDTKQAIWDELREEGRLEEAIAEIERRAEEHADDPDAQVDLGGAYLQKVFDAGAGPAAGLWAMKADKAFDRALALDDHHWDARFSKATSLSFWPPALGKQSEAIHQFETLVAQQELETPHEGFEQSYLMLGNLYQQNGNPDKALATWEKGLQLFPNAQEIAAQVDLAKKQ